MRVISQTGRRRSRVVWVSAGVSGAVCVNRLIRAVIFVQHHFTDLQLNGPREGVHWLITWGKVLRVCSLWPSGQRVDLIRGLWFESQHQRTKTIVITSQRAATVSVCCNKWPWCFTAGLMWMDVLWGTNTVCKNKNLPLSFFSFSFAWKFSLFCF